MIDGIMLAARTLVSPTMRLASEHEAAVPPMAHSPIVMSLATGAVPKIPVTPVTSLGVLPSMPHSREHVPGPFRKRVVASAGISGIERYPVPPAPAGPAQTAMRNRA